jgi:hypothetical protein
MRYRPHEHLAEYLKSTSGIESRPASLAEVATLERSYGVVLPEDFRAYLLEALPACGGNMDDGMTNWWEIELIKNIPDEYANSQWEPHQFKNAEVSAEQNVYLFFADYCIWCAAWAINCGQGVDRGRVVLIDGVKDDFVADSFSEFVGFYLYNAGWPRSPLLNPGTPQPVRMWPAECRRATTASARDRNTRLRSGGSVLRSG